METNYVLTSDSTTYYTDALVQNAVEVESFPGLRGDGNGKIKAITIRSKENLDWQIELYDKSGNILDFQAFPANTAVKYTGTDFNYSLAGQKYIEWQIPLTTPNVTVEIGLRNLSAAAKTTGSDGAVTIALTIEKH